MKKETKDISIKIKIEEEDSEININSSWKDISDTDKKKFFSRIDSLISLFREFNNEYGEEEVEIIAEADDGRIKVKTKIGSNQEEFILNVIEKEDILLEISKRTGINVDQRNIN